MCISPQPLLILLLSFFVAQESPKLTEIHTFLDESCTHCHSGTDPSGNFDVKPLLEFLGSKKTESRPDPKVIAELEKVLRRISSGQMPPPDEQPDADDLENASNNIQQLLANHAASYPYVAKTNSVRRLTRYEYQNAIRDLLKISIDTTELLPKDESSHGFDNITVDELSPTLISRYLTAAEKISRIAIGGSPDLIGKTIRVPADRSQENHVAGLPFGTRGGTMFEHSFPRTGEYEIEIKLTRDRDEKVEGLNRKHKLDVLLDRKQVHQFEVTPPPIATTWEERDFTHSDSHLKTRIRVPAGAHTVGVTFPQTSASIEESKRQPFDANFNRHRHPRKTPAIFQVSVFGPFNAEAESNSNSKSAVYGNHVADAKTNGRFETPEQKREVASKVIKTFATKAWRRPVETEEVERLLNFYDKHSDTGSFDLGLQSAVTATLVNPNFYLRIEQPASSKNKGSLFRISDIELASRLSFFLWSSIPDEELLSLATDSRLSDPEVLNSQVLRMLNDPKSNALVSNFADQWLQLRNLESITPDLRRFPDFDDNLRQAFRGETQNLFREVMTNDENVLQLLQSDHTWLNERLAKHYGIEGVRGDHFRRVDLPSNSVRGGILRHGSIMMVTSYATRTSPTIRGNWVLENILGTPAPPPPPNVPNLKENTHLVTNSVRERLAQHRKDPACASCHDLMDPVGFSLENFDVVGRWRIYDEGIKVDNQGQLPDGTEVSTLEELEDGILERPELFVNVMTEKMMTYALGRGIVPEDGPTIRSIVRQASKDDYRFSKLVLGIVNSRPFQMRSAE